MAEQPLPLTEAGMSGLGRYTRDQTPLPTDRAAAGPVTRMVAEALTGGLRHRQHGKAEKRMPPGIKSPEPGVVLGPCSCHDCHAALFFVELEPGVPVSRVWMERHYERVLDVPIPVFKRHVCTAKDPIRLNFAEDLLERFRDAAR